MNLTALQAISPIDGRYRKQVENLAAYFSEAALMRYRVRVEIAYLIQLAQHGIVHLPKSISEAWLNSLWENFSTENAESIKRSEAITNHDVKAVEYFIKEQLEAAGAGDIKEWVHFGLTSQDINNTAVPLLWKEALEREFFPALQKLLETLHAQAKSWQQRPMLARTHGQPASPTLLGKEWYVFADRLAGQMQALKGIPNKAKFGGATGNFNAHYVAFPSVDWVAFGNELVEQKLGLRRTRYTTQIEPYDGFAAQCDALKRINNILIDFCRDIWTYISMEYFSQATKEGEVGSSAMPHKVNPIDFENAEGNFGMANALYEHLAAKLPISRLQRDLTDSTVLRNIGVPLAHSMIALKSLERGLAKLRLNEKKLDADLEANWAVVAEAIQTVLRREGYPQPYEALKALTRGKGGITQESMHAFIDHLEIRQAIKDELKAITPANYTGIPMSF
ncbi:MAG: adenylosuccinate lyase [Bacteroidetes bacterium]|nr:adenylosuccinate lyase [Bacteroidota bacterium]MBS1630025.1 adenylosuccinate lyase [Bacteroidota bacterium]